MPSFLERKMIKQALPIETRKECGLIVANKIRELTAPLKDEIPPIVYIDSFDTESGKSSQKGWVLKVIQYRPQDHKLYAAQVQFAVAWYDESTTNLFPGNPPRCKLGTPEYFAVEELGIDAWFEHSMALTQVILDLLKKVRSHEKLETPTHKMTGHLLVPVPYSHPELAKNIAF